MAFVSSTPPKYDCEIFNEINTGSYGKDNDKVYDKNSYVDYSDKFLVFVRDDLIYTVRGFLKEQWSLSQLTT
jgi:predicted KAP-like P-loop ATPase